MQKKAYINNVQRNRKEADWLPAQAHSPNKLKQSKGKEVLFLSIDRAVKIYLQLVDRRDEENYKVDFIKTIK